jgi:hypothetical protein
MSIAALLRSDSRFDEFRKITEQTMSSVLGLFWLEIWDMEASQIGDGREGVTVFVPSDAAFDRLEPELAAALTQGDLDNEVLYSLLGHHYVHRLYPSSDWEQGATAHLARGWKSRTDTRSAHLGRVPHRAFRHSRGYRIHPRDRWRRCSQ